MTKRNANLILLSFVVLATLMLLAACSSQEADLNNTAPEETDPPAATATPAPTDPPQPSPTEAPTTAPEPTATEVPQAEPTEVAERPDITIALPEGDPERGKKLALKWRCITCHVNEETVIDLTSTDELPAVGVRGELRLTDAAYSGNATTPGEYLVESVIDPSIYIVPGEWEYEMDDIYAEELAEKDLADVIAWLLTLE